MRVIKLIHTRPLCCSAPCADRLSFSVFALLKLSAIRCCVGGALHGPAASPRAAVLGALAAADDRAAGRARSLARKPVPSHGTWPGNRLAAALVRQVDECGDSHTAAPRAPLTLAEHSIGAVVAAAVRASGS